MKRKLFWISVVVVFIAVAALITLLRTRHEPIPHFVAGAPVSIPHVKFAQYDWLLDAPFENDKLWCWAATSTGLHGYLYDLKNRTIAGELFNGTATGISRRDGSRLLVRNVESSPSFEQELSDIIGKLFGKGSHPPNRTEIFWVLETERNVTTRIGQVSQLGGGGSIWHSSPDFRRGYTTPTAASGYVLSVYDLDNLWLAQFPVNGYPHGWWDDHRILIETSWHQFELFDVETKSVKTLFTPADFQSLLDRVGITDAPDISVFSSWTGTNYDFYFGLRDHIHGLHGNSFLLKANRSGPSFSMISTNFGFRWGGSFNAAGGLYLYQGEAGGPGKGGNGAVYVRNLTNGTESTIVPPDNKGQYAIPRFYGNEVIYFRDRVLHRIELNGSNDSIIFPEMGK